LAAAISSERESLSTINIDASIMHQSNLKRSEACWTLRCNNSQDDLPRRVSLFNVRLASIADFESLTCYRVVDVPLPTNRLASTALRALQVDAELSPLVQRTFSLASPDSMTTAFNREVSNAQPSDANIAQDDHKTILRVEYKATTNRMLRVAVNGFMESLRLVLGIMEELDVDVLDAAR